MPPFSTRIEEEGVQIDNVKLVEGGRLREAEMLALLSGGEYPSRNPRQNLADLKAQIGANEKGVQELHRIVQQFGLAQQGNQASTGSSGPTAPVLHWVTLPRLTWPPAMCS